MRVHSNSSRTKGLVLAILRAMALSTSPSRAVERESPLRDVRCARTLLAGASPPPSTEHSRGQSLELLMIILSPVSHSFYLWCVQKPQITTIVKVNVLVQISYW